jgi:pimeloyl-ACP methyl ester carboxylesterase
MKRKEQTDTKSQGFFYCTLLAAVSIALSFLGSFILSSPSSTYSAKTFIPYKSYGSLSGNPSTDRIIVLIPGLDGATAFFQDLVPELLAAPRSLHHKDAFCPLSTESKEMAKNVTNVTNVTNVQIIIFNLPLLEPEPAMKEQDYTFEFIATSLKTVLDSAINQQHQQNQQQQHNQIQRVDIIGESFGGVVAQYFATMYPDRVNSLCLLSSLAKTSLPPEVKWKLDNLLPIVKLMGTVAPAFGQMLFARLHVDDVVEPHEEQYIRDLFIKEGVRTLTLTFIHEKPQK